MNAPTLGGTQTQDQFISQDQVNSYQALQGKVAKEDKKCNPYDDDFSTRDLGAPRKAM